MDDLRRTPSWVYGLLGGFALIVATAIKAVAAIPTILARRPSLAESAGFAAMVFGMGFVCGYFVGLVRGLARFGRLGNAMIGVLVMNLFFLMCMGVFARSLLSENRAAGAAMLGLATVVGFIGGVAERPISGNGPDR